MKKIETIRIAGVSCRIDKLSTFTYEQLFKMALNSEKYYKKKNAAEDIDKELRSHGFKPIGSHTKQTPSNKSGKGRATDKRGNTRKQQRNSRTRKK